MDVNYLDARLLYLYEKTLCFIFIQFYFLTMTNCIADVAKILSLLLVALQYPHYLSFGNEANVLLLSTLSDEHNCNDNGYDDDN